MSKVICICGKIASGKTYYARQLKEKEAAVILSTDEMTYDLINNEQGEFYDSFAIKANLYLRKKAVEIVKSGVNVILDWGFWTVADRREITKYFKSHDVEYKWHYIDIDDKSWYNNIEERNKLIEQGKGGPNFYVDEGLMKKILSKFEKPTKEEIDVWYKVKR